MLSSRSPPAQQRGPQDALENDAVRQKFVELAPAAKSPYYYSLPKYTRRDDGDDVIANAARPMLAGKSYSG